MIVHGLEDLKKMVEKKEPKFPVCETCGQEYNTDRCPYCAEEDKQLEQEREQDDILEDNEPTQELESDEFYKAFDDVKGAPKNQWTDKMGEGLTKQGMKLLSSEGKKIVFSPEAEKQLEIDEVITPKDKDYKRLNNLQSPDNREASILTNARNRTSQESSAGDAYPREVCNKIMKISKNTLQRIKNLKMSPSEPLGDVVKRLCEFYNDTKRN